MPRVTRALYVENFMCQRRKRRPSEPQSAVTFATLVGPFRRIGRPRNDGASGKRPRQPAVRRAGGRTTLSIVACVVWLVVGGCRFYGRYEMPTPTRRPSIPSNNDTVLQQSRHRRSVRRLIAGLKIIYEERCGLGRAEGGWLALSWATCRSTELAVVPRCT